MEINELIRGTTRLTGLIGNPLEHSISPQLHNTINEILGVDLIYIPLRVEREGLESAVKGLKAMNFIGFNVTVPYKKDIIKFLDENTKEALLMGAVNTVKYIDGRFYGYNTDAEGFCRSFKEESGTGFKKKQVAILGAGGASRAIAVKIAREGASKIHIINRTASNAEDLARLINENIKEVAFHYGTEVMCDREFFKNVDIIINTTSTGMYPEIDESPVEDGFEFFEHQVVYDVIYNPVKTKFLKTAESKGCKTINGFGMLLYQGIYAYEIWTGIKLPESLVALVFDSFTNYIKK